jgi:CheY-like chemotaxis protein
LRILVVDDDLLARMLASVTLELDGYRVEVAENGQEAVEAVRRGDFALILMDIDMPVMTGVEATQAIRTMPGPQREVWIIAVTGSDIGRSKADCQALGFDEVIAKPYHPDALLSAAIWVDAHRPLHSEGA